MSLRHHAVFACCRTPGTLCGGQAVEEGRLKSVFIGHNKVASVKEQLTQDHFSKTRKSVILTLSILVFISI